MGDEEATTKLYSTSSVLSSSLSSSSNALKSPKPVFQPKLSSGNPPNISNALSVSTTSVDHNQQPTLASQSLTSRSGDDNHRPPLSRKSTNFQQLDEILDELVTPPKEFEERKKKMRDRVESFLTYDSDSSSETEDEKKTGGKTSHNSSKTTPPLPKSRSSMREKSVSWIPPRGSSPIPILSNSSSNHTSNSNTNYNSSSVASSLTSEISQTSSNPPNNNSNSNPDSNNTATTGNGGTGGGGEPKKISRCRSEIISLVDGKAPPLPYNIKPKKKIARRIQSIHHIVEKDGPLPINLNRPPTPSSAASSVGGGGSRERGGGEERLGTTTDDEMTTVSGGSDSQRGGRNSSSDRERDMLGDNQSQASSSLLSSSTVRSRRMLVPYRIGDSSLSHDPTNSTSGGGLNSDLAAFTKSLPLREQLRIATLLSSQEAQFGFNMFEALIPGDKEEISRLMRLGYRYEDAILLIFEKRYVTRPEEELANRTVSFSSSSPSSASSPLLASLVSAAGVSGSGVYNQTNAYATDSPAGMGNAFSAPSSPNVSYDYSLRQQVADGPNFSADYIYSQGVYYPQVHVSSPHFHYTSNSGGYSYGYSYFSGGGPVPPLAQSLSSSPSAAAPIAYSTSPAPAMAQISVSTNVAAMPVAGLPPKSPKASSLPLHPYPGHGSSPSPALSASSSVNGSNSSSNPNPRHSHHPHHHIVVQNRSSRASSSASSSAQSLAMSYSPEPSLPSSPLRGPSPMGQFRSEAAATSAKVPLSKP